MTESTLTAEALTTSASATTPAAVLQGYDTFAAAARGTAIGGTTKSINSSERCDYTVCETIESLYKAIEVSANVSADFGVGSIDAKTDYANSLNTTSTSLVIAIYANKVVGCEQYTGAALRQGVPAPTDAHSANAFYHAYGDCFISSITTGCEYVATYAFYCETEEERATVKASLEASGIFDGGEVKGGLDTTIENVRKQQQVRISFQQALFGLSNVQLPDPAHLVDFALGFSKFEPQTPTVISFTTDGYEHVAGMSLDVWAQIRSNRDQFEADISSGGVNAEAAALVDLTNRIDWLRSIYQSYFYESGDSELGAKQKELQSDKNTLLGVIQGVQRDPTGAFAVPALPSLAWGLPVLSFDGPLALVGAGPWGGGGGDPFTDVDRRSVLHQSVLQEITVQGGVNNDSHVDSITCTYGAESPVKHGGSGGDTTQTVAVDAEHPVAYLGGNFTSGIVRLRVRAGSEPNARWINVGGIDGTGFTYDVPTGSVFVGFAGRAGQGVDQLVALTCTFHPTVWKRS